VPLPKGYGRWEKVIESRKLKTVPKNSRTVRRTTATLSSSYQPNDLSRITHVFASLAAILVRMGLDAPQAESLLRKAFVAAVEDSGLKRGTRHTQSEIASIAGVSRLEVRRLMKTRSPRLGITADLHPTRIERVIAGWTTDPDFLDKRRGPMRLDTSGAQSGFAQLARRYGRDVTPKALLNELVRRQVVTVRGTEVALSLGVASRSRQVKAASSDLKFLESQVRGLDFDMGRRTYINRDVSVQASDLKVFRRAQRIATERIEVLLNSLLALGERPKPRDGSNRRATPLLRVSVTIAALHPDRTS
jgi:hypothetical protein